MTLNAAISASAPSFRAATTSPRYAVFESTHEFTIGNRRKSSLIGPCPDGYSSRRPKPVSQLPCEGQSQHRLQKQGQPSVSLKFKIKLPSQ
jgi:hypothetical protein